MTTTISIPAFNYSVRYVLKEDIQETYGIESNLGENVGLR
jgi:hypothetical protein